MELGTFLEQSPVSEYALYCSVKVMADFRMWGLEFACCVILGPSARY